MSIIFQSAPLFAADTDKSIEYILNRVYDSSTNSLNISGDGVLFGGSDPDDDRIYFWDDSESAAAFLQAGSGLSISGDVMTATTASLTGVAVGDGATLAGVTTSAGIFSAITDEVGSGSMVGGTSPTFTTQIITPITYGSSSANGDVEISGTSHVNKTTSYVVLQPSSGDVGIHTSTPLASLHVDGTLNQRQFLVEGFSTQTGDIAVFRKSTEENIFRVSGDGTVFVGGNNYGVMRLSGDSSVTTANSGEMAFDTNAWAASRGAFQFNDGTANTYLIGVLTSDAPSDNQVATWQTGGTVTWEDGGSGSPGGNNGNVQFNDASSFGGDGALNWDKTNNTLSISRDAGQTGYALRISSDTGAVLANISHDGTAYLNTVSISGSGTQSVFTEGLKVNNGSGTDEDDDFTVNVSGGAYEIDAGAGSFTSTANDAGWKIVDQTDNQACTTGCSSACLFGIENATGSAVTNIVSCDSTTADLCSCMGAS